MVVIAVSASMCCSTALTHGAIAGDSAGGNLSLASFILAEQQDKVPVASPAAELHSHSVAIAGDSAGGNLSLASLILAEQ